MDQWKKQRITIIMILESSVMCVQFRISVCSRVLSTDSQKTRTVHEYEMTVMMMIKTILSGFTE